MTDDLLSQQLRLLAATRNPSGGSVDPAPEDVASASLPSGGDDSLTSALRELAAQRPARGSVRTAPTPARIAEGKGGGFGAAIRGAAETGSFNFLDEIGGLADTLLPESVVPNSAGVAHRDTAYNAPNKSFTDVLAANIARRRQQEDQADAADRANHPYARLAGQAYGAVALPVGAGAKGALQVAKVGAVTGALSGAGDGTDLASRVEGAGVGAAAGAAGGALIGRFAPSIARGAGRIVNRVLGRTEPAASEVAGAGAGAAAEAHAPDVVPENTPPAAWSENPNTGERTPVFLEQPANTNRPSLHPANDAAEGTPGISLPEAGGGGRGEQGSGIIGVESPVEGTGRFARADRSLPQVPFEANDNITYLTHEPGSPVAEGAADHAGTVDREGLAAIHAEASAFRERVAAGDDRAPDVTPTNDPEAAARVGNFRLGNLGSGSDTASLLGSLVRTLPDKGVRSDAELMATAHAAAKDIGEDPDAVLAYAQQIAGKLGDADGAMAVLRTIWSKAAGNVNDVHMANIDWSTASDDMVAHAGESIRNLSLLSQQVQTAKAGLGRGLRVNSLPDAESYLAALKSGVSQAADTAPREMPTLPVSRDEISDWMDLWGLTGGDPQAQSKFLQGLLTVPTAGKYLRTSFANFFTASILSAPKTVLLNIVGPSFISVVRNVERMSGAAVQAINPLASAEERQAAAAVARATPIAYVQTFNEVGDAFRQAMRAAELNKTVIGGGGQTLDATTTYGPITKNLLNAAGADPSLAYTLGNLINVWPKAFARVNNGLDEFAKRLAYQGEIRVRSMVEAAQNGLTGDAAHAFVQNKMGEAYDAVGHATDEAMLNSAERTTLTGPVGPDDTYTRGFARALQALRKDIPELRYILPVFNVPANALGETLRRLPITRIPGFNGLFPETVADLAGENGAVAQADAHGRFMLGASFLTAGMLMNRAGLLTGAGPQEATDRKVWMQTHQPYSIRVGDEWVRYDKFDILGGLLSIPATVADASTYRPADQGVGDMMLSGAGALAQWFKDRASLKNAASLFELGDNPTQNAASLFSSLGGTISAGFIPRAIQTLGVDTTDPYNRMRRSWSDYMKSAIPGLSNTLEPSRNVLGEPIQRSADTFAEAILPIIMAPATTYQTDPVMDELDRVYRTTGYGAGADPKSLGYGYFNPKDVKLEDGRSLYDAAMQRRQHMEVDGQTLRGALKDLFNSADYNKAVDADPGQAQTSLGDASRGYMLKQVFDKFSKAIKADLANSSPLADKYLTAAAAKQRDDAYLNGVSVDDLVNNPDLYATHGVNAGAYSDKVRGDDDALIRALGLQ